MALLDRFRRSIEHWVSEDEDAEEAAPPPVIPPSEAEESNQEGLPNYSDGFEAIYSLENVDLKTVRPMAPRHEAVELDAEKPGFSRDVPELEPEIDLGPAYRGWMESFRLSEPIDVLGLSQMAAKALADQDKRLIRDLIDTETQRPVTLSGMGQGHVDEVMDKLNEYVGGEPLFHCPWVDYRGLLRGLLNGLNPKSVFLCLEEYGLEGLIPLNAAQTVEVRHLGAENRAEAIATLKGELRTEGRRKRLLGALAEVTDVFVKPWIRRRGGLANKEQIAERAQNVAADVPSGKNALRCLSELFLEGNFPFAQQLIELEPGLYCADYSVKKRVQSLALRVQSYFYKRGLSYPVHDLIGWIAREQAAQWDQDPEAFILRYLELSSQYRLRKRADGERWLRRA